MLLGSLAAPPHGEWYEVEHARVMVRDAPSVQHGAVLEVLREGCLLLVARVERQEDGTRWARLAAEEMHYSELAKSSTGAAWVLVDGGPLDLGTLLRPALEEVHPPLALWSLPHELLLAHQRAARNHLLRPARVQYTSLGHNSKVATRATESYLCHWRAEESRAEAAEVGWHGDERVGGSAATAVRLAIALLVRDAPESCIDGFLRYHLALGFETVFIFFDDPSDETQSIARRFAGTGSGGGVVVTVCDEAFWDECLRDHALDPALDLQARQAAAVQHAVRLATARGVHWLLHIDIDEMWYSPQPAARADAPAFFAAVPDDVGELVFHNMEAVPPLEGGDCWFTDCTLFKPNEAFLEDSAAALHDTPQPGRPPNSKGATAGVGAMRNEGRFRTLLGVLTYSRAQALGVNLLEQRRRKEGASPAGQGPPRELFSYFSAYSNGKAAVRLFAADGSPVMPIAGVHRSRNIRGRSHACNGPGAPVILHFANCGFEYWIRKYQMLVSAPPCTGGGEGVPQPRAGVAATEPGEGGDRQDDRMHTHRLAREIVGRGDLEEARAFYERSICLEGMLPRLASHGLLVRVLFPSALLGCLRNGSG